MKHNYLIRPITILFILGGLFGNGQAAPVAPQVSVIIIPAGNPIQIAAASWYGSATYQDHFKAVQMAIDDFGPIKGFSVQKNEYDDGCSEIGGNSSGAAIVANTQNLGVIGPLCSSSTIGALPHFDSNHLVMISPGNTKPDLASYSTSAFNRVVVVDPNFDQYWNAMISKLPQVQSWETDFETKYGHAPDTIAKYAYDATILLLTRIQQVSSLSGVDLNVIREELEVAVRHTFNFPSLTGMISLNRYGDRVNKFHRAVWDDSFSLSQLNTRWSWINEQTGNWSLIAKPGFLRMVVKPEPQRLVLPAPKGDFEIGTMVNFEPDQNYQMAGLLVYRSNNDFLALIRAYCDTPSPTCEGNAIYFDYVKNGAFSGSNYATVLAEKKKIWLRLERQGNLYRGYASGNGTEWTLIGTHQASFSPEYVGLTAGNDQGAVPADRTADFDYFVLEGIIGPVSLPLVTK